MELETFVAETLRQIVAGVKSAQVHAQNAGGKVVPDKITFRTDQGLQLWDHRDGTPIQLIEFDVAVTTTEGTGTKGGVGVVAGIFALGSQGSSTNSAQSVGRIKFSVPVSFPKQADSASKT